MQNSQDQVQENEQIDVADVKLDVAARPGEVDLTSSVEEPGSGKSKSDEDKKDANGGSNSEEAPGSDGSETSVPQGYLLKGETQKTISK